MSSKKARPSKEVPREQAPAFLAALSELPAATEVDALERLAAEAKALHNDAMRGNAPEQVALAELRYEAVVYRLNGDTLFGCGAESGAHTRLLALLAAEPGRVPAWGQDGEWLVEVEGMRVRVKARHWMGETISLEFHAVDLDQSFISETGYRSHFMHCHHWFGQEFGAAVRQELLRLLSHKDSKPRPIQDEYRARRGADPVPAWLVPALEGVTRNGQQALPLSGRAPVELLAPAEPETPTAPMSNAERQRLFRQRQREKREQDKRACVQSITLTQVDRMVLSLGLLAHEDLDHRGPNWVKDKKPGFDALLAKLWPEGDDGRYLAEPKRSTYRPAAWLRDRLKDTEAQLARTQEFWHQDRDKLRAAEAESGRLKAALAEIGAELGGAVPAAKAAPAAGVAALQEEVAQLRKALEFEKHERGLLLDERNSGHVAAMEAMREQVVKLRAQVDKTHADHLSTTAELGRALQVTQAMQDRLKAAGLPHDYRQYLG